MMIHIYFPQTTEAMERGMWFRSKTWLHSEFWASLDYTDELVSTKWNSSYTCMKFSKEQIKYMFENFLKRTKERKED